MKTYVITLSKTFQTSHPRKGQATDFRKKLEIILSLFADGKGQIADMPDLLKFHTIRGNYKAWKKRFEEIYRGEACLSIREWEGRPYWSPQVEICRLTKENGISLQKLVFYNGCLQQPIVDEGKTVSVERLAKNDGLTLEDWSAWFKNPDPNEEYAIIHFTMFRY